MMMVFKRKEILVGALIVLIGAAAVVNYNYNRKELNESESVAVTRQVENQAESYSVSAIEEAQEEKEVKMMGEAQQVSAVTDQAADYFSQAKLNRESARSKKLEILNGVLDSESSDAEAKKSAQEDVLKMAEYTDKEAVCENLIVAKGFEKAVVFIGDDNVTVTVKKEDFSDDDALKIQEIVTANTGIDTKYIKIVAV